MSPVKDNYQYICKSCNVKQIRKTGKCPKCGEWDTLISVSLIQQSGSTKSSVQSSTVRSLSQTKLLTSIPEFDRVLGGGFIDGSVTVITGEPGIGKSTLLTQLSGNISSIPEKVLYISAEESIEQVATRIDRVATRNDSFLIRDSNSLTDIVAEIIRIKPRLLIVDSIQTIYDPDLASAPGGLQQVNACAGKLNRLTKESGLITILVGHVTKDGSLAGPKTFEHLVDTVLNFEGDRHHSIRLLRSPKHRFGATGELGIFEMNEAGLVGIPDASAFLLEDRPNNVSGSVVAPIMDEKRPLLMEVQALTNEPLSGGTPMRSVQGFDRARLAMLLAVLEKRCSAYADGLCIQDVLISVVGGLEINEPAGDLPVALAIISAFTDVPADTVIAIGEVGLSGEIRRVVNTEKRLREIERFGFKQAIIPAKSLPECKGISKEIEIIGVENITDAIEVFTKDNKNYRCRIETASRKKSARQSASAAKRLEHR